MGSCKPYPPERKYGIVRNQISPKVPTMTTVTLLREQFGEWLSEEFGVNTKPTGERYKVFDPFGTEIMLRIDDRYSVSFNCHGEFQILDIAGTIDGWEVAYTHISVQEGQRIMRSVGADHNLQFDWDGGNVIITSKKMFCLDRRFTLAKRNLCGGYEDTTEFEVLGGDTRPFSIFPPFPRSTLFEARHLFSTMEGGGIDFDVGGRKQKASERRKIAI